MVFGGVRTSLLVKGLKVNASKTSVEAVDESCQNGGHGRVEFRTGGMAMWSLERGAWPCGV